MAQDEVPVVVQALGLLLILINIVLCLFAVPVCAVSKLTHNLVSNDGLYNTWAESQLRNYMYFLWLPRFLVTLLVLGLIAGQVIAGVLLVGKYAKAEAGVQAAVGIGLLLLMGYGIGFMKRTFKCLEVELKSYISGMLYSFLDAATFFVAVLTTMCVVRASQLCAIGEIAGEHKDHWRRHVLLQLFLTAADIFLLPFIACFLVFPWRLGTVVAVWKAKEGSPLDQRIAVIEQWFRLLFDLPLVFGLVLLLVNPPRFFLALRDVVKMFREVKPEHDDHERRMAVFIQILLTFLDPPALLSRVLVLLTYYREARCRKLLADTYGFYMRHPFLLANPDPAKNAVTRFSAHRVVLWQAFNIVLDIPFAIMGLFVVLTGWRTTHFLRKYRALDQKDGVAVERSATCANPSDQRMLCLRQFFALLLDLPFLFLSLFVFASLYRAGTLFKKLKLNEVPEAEGGYGKAFHQRRMVILNQFCSILLDLPFLFIAFAACLTGVRIYSVFRDLYQHSTASGRRRAVTQQFFLALYDFPCAVFTVVIFVTHYRWTEMRRRLKDPFILGPFAGSPDIQPAPGNEHVKTSVCCCGDNTQRFASHDIVMETGCNILLDIPFILCAGLVMCALFRVPTMYKECKAIRATPAPFSWRLRKLAVRQLFLTCLDIPCFLLGCFVFVLGFYGRGFRLVRDIYRLFQAAAPAPTPPQVGWPASAFRWCVVRHLFLIPFDIPALFCGMLIGLTAYRISTTKRKLVLANASFLGQYHLDTTNMSNLWAPHCILYGQAFQIFVDLPFFLLGAACMLFPWRGYRLCRDICLLNTPKADGSVWEPSTLRWCTVHHFLQLFFDIPTILCGAVICVTYYRVETTKQRLIAKEARFFAPYNPDTAKMGFLLKPHCIVLGQFMRLLVDLPFFVLGGFVCLFPWRSWALIRDLRRLLRGQPSSPARADLPWPAPALRACTVYHFILLFIDVPTIFCGGFICLTAYRINTTQKRIKTTTPGFFREFNPNDFMENSTFAAHCVVMSQAFQILIDTPFFVLALLLTCFPWRGAIFYRDLSRLRKGVPVPPTELGWPASTLRICVVKHAIVLLWDIPTLFAGVLIILTLHRLAHTRRKIAAHSKGFLNEYHPEHSDLETMTKPHKIVLGQALQVFVDLPFILAGVIVFLSGWRSLSLYYEVTLRIDRPDLAKSSHQSRRRRGAIRQLALLVWDLIMLGPLIITLLSIIRFRSLIRQLIRVSRFYTPISSLSLVCAGRVDRELLDRVSAAEVVAADIEMADLREDQQVNPAFVATKNPKPLLVSEDYLWHEVIVDEFFQLFLDLPFFLLAALLLAGPPLLLYWIQWESQQYPATPVWITPIVGIIVFVPWVVRAIHFSYEIYFTFKFHSTGRENKGFFEFTHEYDWAPSRRLLILHHSVMVFLDFPATLSILLIGLTVYRIPHCYKSSKLLWEGTKILLAQHFRAHQERAQAQVNIEEYSATWWHEHRAWENGAFGKGIPLVDRLALHWFLVSQGVSILVDIPFVLCGFFVLATGWRSRIFCLVWKDNLAKYRADNELPRVIPKPTIVPVAPPIPIVDFVLCETCAPLDVASCEKCLAAKNPPVAAPAEAAPEPSRHLRKYVHILGKPWRTLVVNQRWASFANFCALIFVDFPVLIVCGSLLLISVYRLPDLVRKFRQISVRKPEDRTRLLVDQTCGLLADIPFILMGSLVLLTGYRGVALIRDCKYYALTAKHRRRAVIQQIGMFFMDVFALMCLPLLLLTFYRIPQICRQACHPATVGLFNAYGTSNNRVEIQLIIIANFFLMFIDIPFMLLVVIMVGSLWRAPSLLSRLWANKGEWPCTCNAKRAKSKLKEMVAQMKPVSPAVAPEGESSSFSPLIMLPSALMDFTLLPLLDKDALCSLSQASKSTYNSTNSKKLWKDRFMQDFPGALTGVTSLMVERQSRIAELCEDGTEWKKLYGQVHQHRKGGVRRPVIHVGSRVIILDEFGQWLLDLPFLLLACVPLLSGLRTVPLLLDLIVHCNRASERRRTIWHQFVLLFADIIALPTLVPVLLTCYRVPRLCYEILMWQTHLWTPYTRGLRLYDRLATHGLIFWHCRELLLDLPFNIMGVLACAIPYRAYLIYRDMRGKRWSHGEHRLICLAHFVKAVIDIPFIILGAVVLLFPWRSYAMCRLVPARRRACQSRGEKTDILSLFDAWEVYKLVLFNIFIIPFDLLGMALGCLVVIGLWRVPTLKALLDRKFGFRKSLVRTAWLMVKDIFLLGILFPIIIVGIQRIPSTYRNTRRLVARYRREAKQWTAIGKPVEDVKTPEGEHKEAVGRDSSGHQMGPDGLRLEGPKSFVEAYANFQREDAPVKAKRLDGVANFAKGLFVSKGQVLAHLAPIPHADMAPPAAVNDEEREILNMEVDDVFRCGRAHTAPDYPMPVSLSLLRPLFMHEAKVSIKRFHHIILTPIRLLSIPLMPLHWYIGWRKASLDAPPPPSPPPAEQGGDVDNNDDDVPPPPPPPKQQASSAVLGRSDSTDKPPKLTDAEKEAMKESLTMSSLFELVLMLYIRSPIPSLSSWKKFSRQDSFLTCMVFALVPLLLNEMALVLMVPTALFLLLQSCGQRDESAKREKTCSMRKALSCVMSLLQGLLLPVTLALFLACLGFPVIIQILINKRLMVGWVIVQVVLALAGIGTLQLLNRFYRTKVSYHPFELYISIIDFLRARGLAWRLYRAVLTKLVRFTYAIRRSCSILGRILGELLLMVVVLAWVLWPLVPPLLVKETKIWVLIPAPFCLVLLARSRRVVTASWREEPRDLDAEDLAKEAEKEEQQKVQTEAVQTEIEQRRRRTQAERAHLDALAEDRRKMTLTATTSQGPRHISPELPSVSSNAPLYSSPPQFGTASSSSSSASPRTPNSALAKFDLEMQPTKPISSPTGTSLPQDRPGSPLSGDVGGPGGPGGPGHVHPVSPPPASPSASPRIDPPPVPPTDRQWYYENREGKQKGPVDNEGLRHAFVSGELLPSRRVWDNSMVNWTLLSTMSSVLAWLKAGQVFYCPNQHPTTQSGEAGRCSVCHQVFSDSVIISCAQCNFKQCQACTRETIGPPAVKTSPIMSPNMRAMGGNPRNMALTTNWNCSQCTLENPRTQDVCKACQTPRGGSAARWTCSSCTFVNSQTATRCEMCDTAKR